LKRFGLFVSENWRKMTFLIKFQNICFKIALMWNY
jgi:hypothetical protein